jgi:hypothetical protein
MEDMRDSRLRRAELRSQTTELLNGLGSTTDEVVTTLEQNGVRGIPGNGTQCAVARYLHAVMGADPGVREVIVGNHAVNVRPSRRWWSTCVVVPLSPIVCSFIQQFDRGSFASLVDKNSRGLRQMVSVPDADT